MKFPWGSLPTENDITDVTVVSASSRYNTPDDAKIEFKIDVDGTEYGSGVSNIYTGWDPKPENKDYLFMRFPFICNRCVAGINSATCDGDSFPST
jgi:hypothetical protein